MSNQQLRIIISSDVGNEVDDQFALVHALLTPRFVVKGMIAAFFFFNEINSVEKAYYKMHQIAKLTNTLGDYSIVQGDNDSLSLNSIKLTDGAQLIINEALRVDSRPLYILCLAGLTDVAAAITLEPRIAKRFTVIWVGGGRYPDGSHEANLARDLVAANKIMSAICPLWQIPSNTYKLMRVSVADLHWQLANNGRLGKYLLQELDDFIKTNIMLKNWINPEIWTLGDSSAVGVLLEQQKGFYHTQVAPLFRTDWTYDLTVNVTRRSIRVYTKIDQQMIINDMLAKINLIDLKVNENYSSSIK